MTLRALFADLLPPRVERAVAGTAGESGESGESQAATRAAAGSCSGETLAKSGESRSGAVVDSPVFAIASPASIRLQSEQRRGLSPDPPDSPSSGEALMRQDAASAWSEAEIATFVARVALFIRRGMAAADADDLAERLTLRDRDGDDRRCCMECRHLRRNRECAMARAGRLPDVARSFTPMRRLLQRCEGFSEG